MKLCCQQNRVWLNNWIFERQQATILSPWQGVGEQLQCTQTRCPYLDYSQYVEIKSGCIIYFKRCIKVFNFSLLRRAAFHCVKFENRCKFTLSSWNHMYITKEPWTCFFVFISHSFELDHIPPIFHICKNDKEIHFGYQYILWHNG